MAKKINPLQNPTELEFAAMTSKLRCQSRHVVHVLATLTDFYVNSKSFSPDDISEFTGLDQSTVNQSLQEISKWLDDRATR